MTRSDKAAELLSRIVLTAKQSGAYDYMFLAFGSLLGAIRPTMNRDHGGFYRGLMDNDHDMDVGFMPMPKEIIEAYQEACDASGLFGAWPNPAERMGKGGEDDRFVWFSVRFDPHGVKCCNWFMLEHCGYLWHTKGGAKSNWTQDGKIYMKGIPAMYFSTFEPIRFEGVEILAPVRSGSALDFWYPGWAIPAGGCSAKRAMCYINDWKNKNSWEVKL